jgi:hypothetical protein
MNQEILENNILIAEFMGAKKIKYPAPIYGIYKFPVSPDKKHLKIDAIYFEYHNSWEWLIPAIKKCNETTRGYKLPAKYLRIENALIELNREKVYSTIIEFIKSYNQEFFKTEE